MAIFLHHTGCKKCGSSDALAHYSDGSWYCFSCGNTSRATRPVWSYVEEEKQIPALPDDCSTDFDDLVYNWIKPTELTYGELISAQYVFSRSTRRLFRLLHQGGPDSICPTGVDAREHTGGYSFEYRNLDSSSAGPKARFFGSKESTYAITSKNPSTKLILVEDSLSSLKVGRQAASMPLFGSTISNNKLAVLAKHYNEIDVWLDADKFYKAKQISDALKALGVKSKAIYTDLDPKYIKESTIAELL